jgi:hypothetical protein
MIYANQSVFDGSLDEFAVYSSVLSATQVSRHYLTGIGQ